MAIAAPSHRFTVTDYYKMAEAGILGEDDRVELIEGEIVDMAAIGPRHAASVTRLSQFFTESLGGKAIVRTQNPVHIDAYSEPEPDLALVRYRPDFYSAAHPRPGDTYLLVEVADSSLLYDRRVKVVLYSRANVPEVWLVDLVGQMVTAYRGPGPHGYEQVVSFQGEERLNPEAFPDIVFTAAEITG